MTPRCDRPTAAGDVGATLPSLRAGLAMLAEEVRRAQAQSPPQPRLGAGCSGSSA